MTSLACRDTSPPPEPRIRIYTELDNLHPESPAAMCLRLGLAVDLSRYGNPAIIGPTGKRHYYPHGRPVWNTGLKPEMSDLLRRLARRRGIAL